MKKDVTKLLTELDAIRCRIDDLKGREKNTREKLYKKLNLDDLIENQKKFMG